MSRSAKKGPFVDENLIKKINNAKRAGDRKPIKTWARASSITPEMVGLTLEVHNGKNICQYILRNLWLVINLGSLLQLEPSKVMQIVKNKNESI